MPCSSSTQSRCLRDGSRRKMSATAPPPCPANATAALVAAAGAVLSASEPRARRGTRTGTDQGGVGRQSSSERCGTRVRSITRLGTFAGECCGVGQSYVLCGLARRAVAVSSSPTAKGVRAWSSALAASEPRARRGTRTGTDQGGVGRQSSSERCGTRVRSITRLGTFAGECCGVGQSYVLCGLARRAVAVSSSPTAKGVRAWSTPQILSP